MVYGFAPSLRETKQVPARCLRVCGLIPSMGSNVNTKHAGVQNQFNVEHARSAWSDLKYKHSLSSYPYTS